MTREELERGFDIVWNGGEGLIPDRVTKATDFWTPPKRLYNKRSAFWNTPRTRKPVDKRSKSVEDPHGVEEIQPSLPFGPPDGEPPEAMGESPQAQTEGPSLPLFPQGDETCPSSTS